MEEEVVVVVVMELPGLLMEEALAEVTGVVAAMVVVAMVVAAMVVVAMVEGPRLPAMESETPLARGNLRRNYDHWRRKMEKERRRKLRRRGQERRARPRGRQFIKASEIQEMREKILGKCYLWT